MVHSLLRLTFYDDGDGTGELTAEATADGYAGIGSAYFNIDKLKRFTKAIGEFPLPERALCQIAGGFCSKEVRGELEQEHLGIDVYPVDHRGHNRGFCTDFYATLAGHTTGLAKDCKNRNHHQL